MKTTSETKSTSRANLQPTKPFFNKNGGGAFFSNSEEVKPSFFTPSNVQTKLTIGEPGDKYEQEADTMAENVVEKMDRSNSTSVVQNKCEDCAHEEMEISNRPIFESHDRINNKIIPGKGINEVDSNIETQLQNSKGQGQFLEKQTRQNMEKSFSADFTSVKIHTDNNAVQMSQNLGAQAFTNGSDIYFNQEQYNPDSTKGKKLLAHELTHTIQQGNSPTLSTSTKTEPNQGGGIDEDKLLPLQAISKIPQARIQRVANWNAAGPVHESINLANMMIGRGGTPVTWPTLNGTQFWSGPEALAALKLPTISTRQTSSHAGTGAVIGGVVGAGIGALLGGAGGALVGGIIGGIGGGLIGSQFGTFKAKVTSVDTNTASFDETVLTRPPWSTVAPQATVNSQYGIAACSGAGNTTFEAKGDPNNNDIRTANRRHENHHADDHKVAFDNTIKPWDVRLTQAMNNGTEYSGSSAAAAEANLWTAMGGTPTQIATAFFNQCQAAVIAYHGSVQGGPFGTSGSGSDASCTNSWVNVTNPS